jgi:hypothetical protein
MAINLSKNEKLGRIKSIMVFIIPFALYFVPIDWVNEQHSICLFKNIFGIECYGCGITRAVLSVIQFDFVNAYHYNKLVIIVFPLLFYLWGKNFYELLRSFSPFQTCKTVVTTSNAMKE